MVMRPYILCIAKKAINSMVVANAQSVTFVFNVMARSSTKLSKWFLYSFVFKNHLLNLSDPFAKHPAASSKNGVVGSMGNAAPTAPTPKHINPHITKKAFFMVSPLQFQFLPHAAVFVCVCLVHVL